MFAWIRRRRRRRLLAEPFPPEWERTLASNVWQFACLAGPDQATLREVLRLLTAEKNWEGCGGLELTDEVCVTVAAYAALLILRLDPESYDHVRSILMYPEDYVAPQTTVTPSGLERVEMSHRAGEAWRGGTVVLSWADVVTRRGGTNVVVHEFAHQLDMLNRDVDGTPPLRDAAAVRRWREVMTAAYDRHVRDTEQGRPTLLGSYAATDPAEFFAVATECFFERPARLLRRHADLYDALRGYYGQDPANWAAPT